MTARRMFFLATVMAVPAAVLSCQEPPPSRESRSDTAESEAQVTILLPSGDSFALDDVKIDRSSKNLGLQDAADEARAVDEGGDGELVVELEDESEEANAVARLFADRSGDSDEGLALKGKQPAPAAKAPAAKKPIVITATKPVEKAPRPEKTASGTVTSKGGNTYEVALASSAKGQKAQVSVNEIIDLKDFVLPKMQVQAFHGTMNGKSYRVTNYREDLRNGNVRFYQVFAGNPKQFVVKDWTDDGFFARLDMLQWYSYPDGRMLPAKPRIGTPYIQNTTIQWYQPGSCALKGEPQPYSWTRTVVGHFKEEVGSLGIQDMIRVVYRHAEKECPSGVSEYMDFSRQYGQLRWFAECHGKVTNMREATDLANDATMPDKSLMCR